MNQLSQCNFPLIILPSLFNEETLSEVKMTQASIELLVCTQGTKVQNCKFTFKSFFLMMIILEFHFKG